MDIPDHLKQFEDRLVQAREELLRIADELENVCNHPPEMVGGYDGWGRSVSALRVCVLCGKEESRDEGYEGTFTLPKPTFELDWENSRIYSRRGNLFHLSRFTIQGRMETLENARKLRKLLAE